MRNSKLMIEGQLDEFLNKIVYQQSEDDFGLMDVDRID